MRGFFLRFTNTFSPSGRKACFAVSKVTDESKWRARKKSRCRAALTKAFLNCNELPKSELCAVQVPSSPRRTPSYKSLSMYVYIWHPRAAQPPHVMNIFTLIVRLGIFHLTRRCVRFSLSLSLTPLLFLSFYPRYILYLYRRDVSVFPRRSLQYSFHRETRRSLMILSSFDHILPGSPSSFRAASR